MLTFIDTTPTAFSTSYAQILGPEITLITVIKYNVLKTDSS